MSLKTQEIYYNVDRNYWSDALGNISVPSCVPRFSLYEHSVIKLHLIHDGGTEVVDYSDSQLFGFVAYDYNGTPVIASDSSKINSPEAIAYWEEIEAEPAVPPDTPAIEFVEGANTEKGRFAIIVNCATTELRDALAGKDNCLFKIEFTVAENATVLTVLKEKCYFDNVLASTDTIQELIFGNPIVSGELPISIGSSFILLTESADDYTLSSVMVQAPDNAEHVYTVANVSIGDGAFKVWFNATVQEDSHKVIYTLVKKGN